MQSATTPSFNQSDDIDSLIEIGDVVSSVIKSIIAQAAFDEKITPEFATFLIDNIDHMGS